MSLKSKIWLIVASASLVLTLGGVTHAKADSTTPASAGSSNTTPVASQTGTVYK